MAMMAIFNSIAWDLQGWQGLAASASAPALRAWPETVASTLINSLWQGAVVACGVALCLRLAPKIPARMRYEIWAAGFAALVCLPFLPAAFEHFALHSSAAIPAFALAAGSVSYSLPTRAWLALDWRWSLAIAALWLAASLVRAASLFAHAIRMRRLWRSAVPVPDSTVIESVENVGARWAGRAQLCVTSDLDRPCVIGFFRPRILIPAWLLARLTSAELEQVVLHESEHLRRWDDWTNFVQKLCLVVFPLNPALWWLERRLCAEREMACDDSVVGRTNAPRAYAACLAGLAERGLERRQTALSLGAWQRRPELATRIHRLLRRPSVLSPAASKVSVAIVVCGLVAGVIALADPPQLVSFVAPVSQPSNALGSSARSTQASVQGDALTDFVPSPIAFAGASNQPYRAVKTMAILPSAGAAFESRDSVAALMRVSPKQPDQAQQTDESSHPGRSLADIIPNAIEAGTKAQKDSQIGARATEAGAIQANSGQRDATQTGWLVLTTFEEVRTTGGEEGDAVVAEASANAGDAARGENTVPSTKDSTSISVTRLVLRFVEPASNDKRISNAQPASNVPPSSNSAQPIAIPYRDGWFVIQL